MRNEPQWVDVDVEGEFTGEKYFGRFLLKPYLTNGERADAGRLAEMYFRGIKEDTAMRLFLTTLAFLKFHVQETDASWWENGEGLEIQDESPVYKLAEKLQEVQKAKKKTSSEEKTME